MLISVDLPAPFGPMMELIRPGPEGEADLVDRDQRAEPLGDRSRRDHRQPSRRMSQAGS